MNEDSSPSVTRFRLILGLAPSNSCGHFIKELISIKMAAAAKRINKKPPYVRNLRNLLQKLCFSSIFGSMVLSFSQLSNRFL